MVMKDRLKELQTLAVLHNNGKFDEPDVMDVCFLDVPDESTSFLRMDGWSELEMFLGRVTATNNQVEEMRSCLKHMRKIHSEILISPGVHSKFTEELNDNVDNFKRLTHIVSDSLKVMNTEIAVSNESSDASSRIKINQVNALNRRLHELLFQFNNEQIVYRDKCKTKINSYLSIAGLQMPEEEVDEAIEKGQLFSTVGILMAERDKKVLFDDVKSRHEDIVRLEKSIRELHDMFQDMSMLITSQSCLVNNIEANVQNTVDYTNRALYSVNCAKASQRRNMKLLCCSPASLKICLLILLIVAVLTIFSVGGAVFCFYFPFACRS